MCLHIDVITVFKIRQYELTIFSQNGMAEIVGETLDCESIGVNLVRRPIRRTPLVLSDTGMF